MDCSQSASQVCTLSWTWLESNSCSIGSIQFLWVVEAGSCFPPGFQLAATLRPLPWVYFLPQRQLKSHAMLSSHAIFDFWVIRTSQFMSILRVFHNGKLPTEEEGILRRYLQVGPTQCLLLGTYTQLSSFGRVFPKTNHILQFKIM